MFENFGLRPLSQRIFLISLFVIPVLMLVAAYPAYHYVKIWRSGYLMEQSQAFYEKEDYVKAYQKALSASYLNPKSTAVKLNLARKGTKVSHPHNLDWWLEVIDLPERTSSDLIDFLTVALRKEELGEANRVLSLYGDELPEDEEAWQLRVAILQAQHQNFAALQFLESLLKAGKDTWFVHRMFISLSFFQTSPGYTEQAISHLEEQAKRPDDIGIKSIRWLLRCEEVAEQEYWMKQLIAHPLANKSDSLYRYYFELRTGERSFEEIRDEMLSIFDENNLDDMRLLTTWLSKLGKGKMNLEFIDEVKAKGDQKLFFNLLSAKIQEGDAKAAFDLTLMENDENPLSTVENLIARSRSLKASGNEVQFRQNLRLAIEVTETDGYALVESELILLKEWDLLIDLYTKLIALEDEEARALGQSKLCLIYYRTLKEEEIYDLLTDLQFDAFENNPSFQNFIAYLNILYGVRIQESRRMLESLLTSYPTFVDFRITLAFAYEHLGQIDFAQALLQGLEGPLQDLDQRRILQIALMSVFKGEVERLEALGVDLERVEKSPMLSRERRIFEAFFSEVQPKS